jgi:hypothetical protein
LISYRDVKFGNSSKPPPCNICIINPSYTFVFDVIYIYVVFLISAAKKIDFKIHGVTLSINESMSLISIDRITKSMKSYQVLPYRVNLNNSFQHKSTLLDKLEHHYQMNMIVN